MSFMCQKDSYLKEFTAKVVSCTPTKKKKEDGYNVILNDTILFPEGGGQPCDWGTMNEVTCSDIKRVGASAVHFITKELAEGTDVKLKVNWERRFDHMQQHTAQHLVTATADRMFGYQTTSWDIGVSPNVVSIELNTPTITGSQLKEIEAAANESLQNNLPVTPSFYDDKNDPELKKFRGLGLPDDHVGIVRVLSIDGVDDALCCGTHVSNLAHIQAIKIVGAEKGKKGKVNLLFLAGQRLLHYAQTCYDREKKLTGVLKGAGDKHCELAEKAIKHSKALQKNYTSFVKELASMDAKLFNLSEKRDCLFAKHRKEVDQDYVSVLLAELGDQTLPKLITTGDDKDGGTFVLAGPSQMLQDIGAKVCEAFEGKGAPSKGQYKGKAGKPEKGRLKAEALIREYLTKANGDGDSRQEVEDNDQGELDKDESEAELSTDSETDVKEQSEKDEKDGDTPQKSDKTDKVKSKQRKKSVKVVSKRVVVYNIPYELSWQELKDEFRKEVGEVIRVELLETPEGKSQGMAAVEFSDLEHARRAIELFHNRKMKGRSVKVREEKEQDRFKLLHCQKMKAAKGMGVLGPAPGPGDYSFSGVNALSGLNKLSGLNTILQQLGSTSSANVSDTILVSNLDYRVTYKKLKDVFKLAGHVVQMEMKGDQNSGVVAIQFENHLEAIQAVSMFDNQLLYDSKMAVKLIHNELTNLPSGLQTIGRGLGPGGNPVRSLGSSAGMNGQSLSLSEQLLHQEYAGLGGRLGLGNHGLMGSGIGTLGNLGNQGYFNNFNGNLAHNGGGIRGNGDKKGPCCVMVTNLGYNSDWKALKEHFCDVGEVKFAEVNIDKTGKSTGVGYVRFASFDEAQRAIMLKNKSRLGRRNIDVKFKT